MPSKPIPDSPADLSNGVLVTGLSGLMGSMLRARNRTGIPLHAVVPEGTHDISSREDVESSFESFPGARVAIHLAAFTDTNAAHLQQGDESGPCYRINVLGSRYVAEACARRGIHLVHISTDYVYEGNRPEPYTEADEPRPIDWYGRTKHLGEQEARRAGSWTIVRLGFPYGLPEGQRDLLGKIIRKFRAGETLHLFDDQIITPTYLPDIADGLLKLAEIGAPGELFHLVGSEPMSPLDFGRAVAREFGLPESRIEPSRVDDLLKTDPRPRHRTLRVENRKWSDFAERHGLPPPVGVAEGLRRAHSGRG